MKRPTAAIGANRCESIRRLRMLLSNADFVRFLTTVISSGEVDGIPFIKTLDGTVLFSATHYKQTYYADVFKKGKRDLIRLGVGRRSFGALSDAMVAYTTENTSMYPLLVRTDLLRPGDVVLDVGARHAIWATKAAKTVGRLGRVICIDATESARQYVALHTKFNDINLQFISAVVGDIDGQTTSFFSGSETENYSSLFRETYSKIDGAQVVRADHHVAETRITMRTIDALVEQHALPRCDFISLQINGGEVMAVKGAKATISRFLPTIFASAYQSPSGEIDGKSEIESLLSPIGYVRFFESASDAAFVHATRLE